jgi:hypothetical protein
MMNSLTKQQCEWPDPARPLVPLHPEKDGWHWMKTPDNEVMPFEWRAEGECERGHWPSYWVSQGEDCWTAEECEYIGPCLTPDEATALQARAVKWAGIVGTLIAERDQLIGALQIAIERSGDLEPRPAWVDGACGLLNRGFLKVDRAAPKDEPFS